VAEHIALYPRPLTVDEVDRRLRIILQHRDEAVSEPTPDSADEVARCDAAIDQLLQLRLDLTRSADDPAGT
jgi:hypothetical protein